MGIFSIKCVSCKEQTKRCTGPYQSTDPDDKDEIVGGKLYECENDHCEIKRAIKRGIKETHLKQASQIHSNRAEKYQKYQKNMEPRSKKGKCKRKDRYRHE